jgi:hypothetical protein
MNAKQIHHIGPSLHRALLLANTTEYGVEEGEIYRGGHAFDPERAPQKSEVLLEDAMSDWAVN